MVKNTTLLIDGRTVTIRPIRPTDAGIEADFVRHLSPLKRHYRFFAAVNELPAAEVSRLCNVDGIESMAFVATIQEGGREVQIGVCRFAPGVKSDAREMAVTIADKWQQSDLAELLMRHLIQAAKQQGVHELYAVELGDNREMLDFAKKLGMSEKRDPGDAAQVIYSIPI